MTIWPKPASGTNRGIHWSASCGHSYPLAKWPYWKRELAEMGIGWAKLLDDSRGSSLHMCEKLLEAGIIPIVRLYRSRPCPGMLDQDALATVSRLVAIGVRYFESGNEPNLAHEWDSAAWARTSWQERIHTVMNSWLSDALRIIESGGLPGFPALAQCAYTQDDAAIGSIPFYVQAISYIAAVRKDFARQLFQNGAWLAVHDATLNHFYKDGQGQWHFEYPHDPICQADQSGKTVMHDDNSLIGHRVAVQLLQEQLGVSVPVISTEGGIFVPQDGWEQWDTRYPPLTYERQAEGTVAMYDWLARNEPGVLAMCPWLIANERMGHNDRAWTQGAWYHEDGPRPVVAAMKASNVPPVTEAGIREAAWNKLGRAYNPDAAFQKYAGLHGLGFPVTDEFDLGKYRVQGYGGGIVYAEIGKWGDVKHLPWSEKLAAAIVRKGWLARAVEWLLLGRVEEA